MDVNFVEELPPALDANGHVIGWPVGATTYGHAGCRCDACTADSTAKMARARRKRDGALIRVQSRQQSLMLKWMRHHHPEVCAELLGQAYEELGIERRPIGRPRK